ncbi:MAG: Tim44 domain-containing protein [Candidatus Tectomicrobia bacterium]|uniref:Tim44 domain-containing protein n=1 Tax=Tectimicrobiota bacterium TaxID=2528274 RepID=A0A932HYN2_UNCTE|nr:Tim44 domain-containing protein [Candidatus Tectomicrobia bacterium]
MRRIAILSAFFIFFLTWPVHMGVPAPGPGGLILVRSEAEAARFGGGRSFGFRGSRGFARPSPASPRSGLAQPGYDQTRRPFGGFGGGLFAGLGGLLLGGLIGSLLFGRMGMGGIGLLEILLIGGGLFLLFRMFGGRRREAPQGGGTYTGRLATAEADPYGVGGGPAPAERARGSVYTGPDIAARGASGPAASPGPSARPSAGAAPDPGLEEGLSAIRASDPSFSRENFLLDARRGFLRFQEAWVARDLAPIRDAVDRDIYEKSQSDLDELRREGRVNRLDDIQVRRLDLAEAWQEEGFDFATVRVEASLLDYLVSETSGELLGGSRTEPVTFAELWTWARKTGPNKWFLSAIEQG